MGIKKDKKAKDSKMGMAKHRKSGHVCNANHFTGKKKKSQTRRKKKLDGKPSLTRKQRKIKRRSRVNKYAIKSS